MQTKSAAIWILMCGAALGVGAVAAYVERTPALPHQPAEAESTVTRTILPAKPPEAPPRAKAVTNVFVYVPEMDADGISFSKQEVSVPDGADPKLVAVNEFLKASQVAPPEAKALSISVQSDGSASIVFNQAFDQTYGTFDEKKLLDGLAAAIGQFQDVETFTISAGDKQLTTLGSADLTNPIPVARPDAVPMHKLPSNPANESAKPE
jgi:hypothetical protein